MIDNFFTAFMGVFQLGIMIGGILVACLLVAAAIEIVYGFITGKE